MPEPQSTLQEVCPVPNYRRWYVPGGTYFFTPVVYQRRQLFREELARATLRSALEGVKARWRFEIVAAVLLPDHLHMIWTLPRGDADFSTRWKRVKADFTRMYLKAGGTEGVVTASRRKHGERGIWQRRFWEHVVEDAEELKRCVDYVHWNPVKHGYVSDVRDWPWSTFHRFLARGEYEPGWGSEDPTPGYNDPEWWGDA